MAERSVEFVMSQIVPTLAVVSGVGMLLGFNWARWLLVGWLGYHVILSIFHPLFELLVHGLLFVVVLYFLFRTQVSAYFKGTAQHPRQFQSKTRRSQNIWKGGPQIKR